MNDLTPVTFYPDFLTTERADDAFARLRNELDWVRFDKVPRAEYHWNRHGKVYTYGRGRGVRAYECQPDHEIIREIRMYLHFLLGAPFDVCHLNMYEDASDSLGWHADDSPEMSHDFPIVTVSLGGERPIQFKKPEWTNGEADEIKMTHGSMASMHPGMQRDWVHRIPKVGYIVPPRISLTFRVMVR